MVIYFILGLVFALFCIFVVVLYQVNIIPVNKQLEFLLDDKIKDISEKKHFLPQNTNQSTNAAATAFIISIPSSLSSSSSTTEHSSNSNDIYINKSNIPTAIKTTFDNTKTLKLLNINLNVDEDCLTMLFKIPGENYINGIHIIYNNFVLSVVFIHKENSNNLRNVKSKINDELDNLSNVYPYTHNIACLFNYDMGLLANCGKIGINDNIKLVGRVFYLASMLSVQKNRFSDAEDNIIGNESLVGINPSSLTYISSEELNFYKKVDDDVNGFGNNIVDVGGYDDNDNDNDDDDDDDKNHNDQSTSTATNPPTAVFQNNNEMGFKDELRNTQFKKNIIPNKTLNIITNIKNAII